MACTILYVLLAIQQQPEKGAEKKFHAIAGNGLDNVAFEFLGSEMGHGLWKCIAKPAPIHDNELATS